MAKNRLGVRGVPSKAFVNRFYGGLITILGIIVGDNLTDGAITRLLHFFGESLPNPFAEISRG